MRGLQDRARTFFSCIVVSSLRSCLVVVVVVARPDLLLLPILCDKRRHANGICFFWLTIICYVMLLSIFWSALNREKKVKKRKKGGEGVEGGGKGSERITTGP